MRCIADYLKSESIFDNYYFTGSRYCQIAQKRINWDDETGVLASSWRNGKLYTLLPYFFSEKTGLDVNNIWSVYDSVNWKKVDIELTDVNGNTIFELKGAEFPEDFSGQACEIIASKYFRQIPYSDEMETSFKQVVHRMANYWTEQLLDEELMDEASAIVFYNEVAYTLLHQYWAPNSPQWFNTGLSIYLDETDALTHEEYTDGGYWYSPKEDKPVPIKERYSRPQASACFITSIEDKLLGKDSITDHYITETRLFKEGSGTGTNFSNIRAKGERLSGGGTSSGLMSFLDGLDRNAGAIKSGGTTRRAAKMVILDIDHPEIEDFIDWKVKEEEKAKVLIQAGYDGSIGGEAYSTVSGQNSNNSVRLDRRFMSQVLSHNPDATYLLRGRVDHSVDREVNVQELWRKIAEAAWSCADPGVQFDDRYNEWNTCVMSGHINATNPCSEFAFIDNTACNLASINVMKMLDDDNTFSFYDYRKMIEICQLVLEATIVGGRFPTYDICKNSHDYRPTGLGLTNFASFLLSKKVAYDSDLGRYWGGTLASVMTDESYRTSLRMGRVIGPFKEYKNNSQYMSYVLDKHADAFKRLDNMIDEYALNYGETDETQELKDSLRFGWEWWTDRTEPLFNMPFRNAQVTVMAPTGTISFAMDCKSTGIEPFYSHTLYKKTADGCYMTIVNPLADEYVMDLKLDDDIIVEIMKQYNIDGTYQNIDMLSDEDKNILKTANEISPEAHLEMMSYFQPFISGSISKTVNMPEESTVEDIMQVYEKAYTLGLKSVSIYRDNSKGVQPLSGKKDDEEQETYNEEMDDTEVKSDNERELDEIIDGYNSVFDLDIPEYKYPKRVRPSGLRDSRTHSAKIGDVELYITIGYYDDGTMAELFASSDKDGTVVKGLLSSLSKAVSYMLQYGIDPMEISKMLKGQKYEPAGVVERHPYIKMADSISDLISRIIEMECGDYTRCQVKPYKGDSVTVKLSSVKVLNGVSLIEDEEEDTVRLYGETCPVCGSNNLVQSGTCKTCMDCGSTTGCG